MKSHCSLEYRWMSEQERTSIFTHVMWDMYWAPPGFCFDTNCADPAMVVNKKSPEFNVYKRVQDMVDYLEKQVLQLSY